MLFFSLQVEFLSEADTMKLLSHPNLVKLLAVCTTGEPVYIIMELMIHGKQPVYHRRANLYYYLAYDKW